MKTIYDIALHKKDRDAIREATALLKQKFPVVEMKLFGSKARGDADIESDIDLLALTSRLLSWQERNAMTDSLYDIQIKYNVVISLLTVPAKEWTSGLITALPIHDAIEKEGIAA